MVVANLLRWNAPPAFILIVLMLQWHTKMNLSEEGPQSGLSVGRSGGERVRL